MRGLNGAPTTPPDRLSSSLDRLPVVCMHAQPHVHAGARGLDKYFPTRYRRSPLALDPLFHSRPVPPLNPRLIIRLRARFTFFSCFSRFTFFRGAFVARRAIIDSPCEEWHRRLFFIACTLPGRRMISLSFALLRFIEALSRFPFALDLLCIGD